MPIVPSVPVLTTQWENVYQDSTNMRESRATAINSQCVKEAFRSTDMGGGDISIDLPHGPLLSHCLVCLKLKTADLPAGAFLEAGWGYKAINWYEQIASNSSNQLRINGDMLLTRALADCETAEKRAALLQLGGPVYNGVPTSIKGEFLTAYIHIYLPFSNISATRYLPYDSMVLNKPYSLRFNLRASNELFSIAKPLKAAVEATLPTKWSEIYLMIQTAQLAAGPSASISQVVGANGSSSYVYGWSFPSYYYSSPFDGSSDKSNKCEVRLESFRNGSLSSMDIYLERLTLGNAAATGPPAVEANLTIKGNVPNAFVAYEDLSNVEITYGGQCIYRSSDKSYMLMGLSEYTTEPQFKYSFPNMGVDMAIDNPIFTQEKTVKWVHVQLSQYNENFFTNLVQSGVSLVNNMCSITFNTPDPSELSNGTVGATSKPVPLAIDPAQKIKYRLVVRYNYQAALTTYKGETDYTFLNPSSRGPYTMAN